MVHRGLQHRRVALWIAVLCTALPAAVIAGPALARARHHRKKHKPVGACNAHRKHAALVTPRVIIYGKRHGVVESDIPVTAYYACLRAAGKSTQLGLDAPGDGEYPSNETTDTFRVSGTYAAAESTAGEEDTAVCEKYDPSDPANPCPPAVTWIEVVQAQSQRKLAIPTGPIGVAAMVVSSSGGVAWVAYSVDNSSPTGFDTTLYAEALEPGTPGQLTGTAQTLDTGNLGLKSLRWSGLTLSWTNAGQPHSATLSPAAPPNPTPPPAAPPSQTPPPNGAA